MRALVVILATIGLSACDSNRQVAFTSAAELAKPVEAKPRVPVAVEVFAIAATETSLVGTMDTPLVAIAETPLVAAVEAPPVTIEESSAVTVPEVSVIPAERPAAAPDATVIKSPAEAVAAADAEKLRRLNAAVSEYRVNVEQILTLIWSNPARPARESATLAPVVERLLSINDRLLKQPKLSEADRRMLSESAEVLRNVRRTLPGAN